MDTTKCAFCGTDAEVKTSNGEALTHKGEKFLAGHYRPDTKPCLYGSGRLVKDNKVLK